MRTSVNFHQHFVKWETFCQLLSTSFASERPFVNFCQLYLWPEHLTSIFCAAGDIPSAFINFLCHQETYRHLQSTFHATQTSSVNFCQLSVPPVDLPSIFRAAETPYVSFRQHSVRVGDHLSTSVKFPCCR